MVFLGICETRPYAFGRHVGVADEEPGQYSGLRLSRIFSMRFRIRSSNMEWVRR